MNYANDLVTRPSSRFLYMRRFVLGWNFIRLATVREFKASEPVIDLFGNMAVATCPWEISYRMNDQDYHESGRDLLVLTREEGEWQVAWRAVLSSPSL